MMTLQRLTIRQHDSYEANPGKYTALVEYAGERGEIKTTLSPEISEAVLAFVAPQITKFASQAALEIEQNILLSVEEAKKLPQIEA